MKNSMSSGQEAYSHQAGQLNTLTVMQSYIKLNLTLRGIGTVTSLEDYRRLFDVSGGKLNGAIVKYRGNMSANSINQVSETRAQGIENVLGKNGRLLIEKVQAFIKINADSHAARWRPGDPNEKYDITDEKIAKETAEQAILQYETMGSYIYWSSIVYGIIKIAYTTNQKQGIDSMFRNGWINGYETGYRTDMDIQKSVAGLLNNLTTYVANNLQDPNAQIIKNNVSDFWGVVNGTKSNSQLTNAIGAIVTQKQPWDNKPKNENQTKSNQYSIDASGYNMHKYERTEESKAIFEQADKQHKQNKQKTATTKNSTTVEKSTNKPTIKTKGPGKPVDPFN